MTEMTLESSIPMQPTVAVLTLFETAVTTVADLAGRRELTLTGLRVFLKVASDPGRAAVWYAEQLDESRATISHTMKSLSPKGLDLVEEIMDPRHSSRKMYFATRKGQRILIQVAAILLRSATDSVEQKALSESTATHSSARQNLKPSPRSTEQIIKMVAQGNKAEGEEA